MALPPGDGKHKHVDPRSLAESDMCAARREFLWAPPSLPLRSRLVDALLEDPRDAPALYLFLNVVAMALPAAILLHMLPTTPHWLGVAYLVANDVLFLQRFVLTLHYTQHRRLFKTGLPVPLDWVLPNLLAPLYGVPSGAYRLHHNVMHHVGNNHALWDLSSTEPYQRDNALHFLTYWLRFALVASLELPLYGWRCSYRGWALQSGAWIAAYWAAIVLLWQRNTVATLYTLVLPFVITSLALMLGNWSQHIFIEPSAPHDNYLLAYNCIACPDNSMSYNDGYHILHHLNSRTHWSQLPQTFCGKLAEHDEHDALVFKGIGFMDVGVAVLSGRLEWVVDHIVPCGPRQARRSREEWVALLRRRLRPIQRHAGHPRAAACEG